MSATAPLGGCRQPSTIMAAIASDTAIAAAMIGSPIVNAQVTPMAAATVFPPSTDQGCASGLAGAAKSRTADAPIGAISSGWAPEPRAIVLTKPVSKMPTRRTSRGTKPFEPAHRSEGRDQSLQEVACLGHEISGEYAQCPGKVRASIACCPQNRHAMLT